MLKQLFTGGSVLALLLVGSLSAQAQAPAPQPSAPASPQTQVKPEELQKFVNSVKQILLLEQGAQTEMEQAVKAEGLSKERFIEIFQTQRNPQAQPKTAITPQEKQQFDKASTKLEEIQQKTQAKMTQVIQSQGLQLQRFNQILTTVRQDPALRQQVQQMIKS